MFTSPERAREHALDRANDVPYNLNDRLFVPRGEDQIDADLLASG